MDDKNMYRIYRAIDIDCIDIMEMHHEYMQQCLTDIINEWENEGIEQKKKMAERRRRAAENNVWFYRI